MNRRSFWLPSSTIKHARRSVWTGSLNVEFRRRNTVVFTAGAPGSGKTYTVNKLFGLSQFNLLDLDSVIKRHPDFNPEFQHQVYDKAAAYRWADDEVERVYQEQLRLGKQREEGGGSTETETETGTETCPPVRICVDGTGTNTERQLRRIRDAKEAGFYVVKVFVKVTLETCIERNSKRDRSVPTKVVAEYLEQVDDAVATILAADIVDCYISMDNERPDDKQTDQERFGEAYPKVARASLTNKHLFDAEDNSGRNADNNEYSLN